jgi:hypothetical protein
MLNLTVENLQTTHGVGGTQLIIPKAREEGSNWRPGKQINVADRALSTSQVITGELQSPTTSPAFTSPVRTYVSLLSHSNTRSAAHVTCPPAGFPSLDSEQPGFGVFRKSRPRLCPPTTGVGVKVELIGGGASRVIGDDASGYINIL